MLRDLVRETGCSYEALASRINHLGGRDRLQLTYGRSALAQWISGHVAPPRVRDLCAAVLSSKLGGAGRWRGVSCRLEPGTRRALVRARGSAVHRHGQLPTVRRTLARRVAAVAGWSQATMGWPQEYQ